MKEILSRLKEPFASTEVKYRLGSKYDDGRCFSMSMRALAKIDLTKSSEPKAGILQCELSR